jgi:spore maturation protein SpmA
MRKFGGVEQAMWAASALRLKNFRALRRVNTSKTRSSNVVRVLVQFNTQSIHALDTLKAFVVPTHISQNAGAAPTPLEQTRLKAIEVGLCARYTERPLSRRVVS